MNSQIAGELDTRHDVFKLLVKWFPYGGIWDMSHSENDLHGAAV